MSGDVNVDNSVGIESEQMHDYDTVWPQNYHSCLKKMVITMQAVRKNIKVSDTSDFDTELIVTRVMGLQQSRNLNINDVMTYELFPVPTALFDDNETMKIWLI